MGVNRSRRKPLNARAWPWSGAVTAVAIVAALAVSLPALPHDLPGSGAHSPPSAASYHHAQHGALAHLLAPPAHAFSSADLASYSSTPPPPPPPPPPPLPPIPPVDPPAIVVNKAAVTAHNEVTIRYSKAVDGTLDDYTSLTVAGRARTVSTVSGGGTAAHVITFSPGGAPVDSTGSVMINASAVADQGGTALGTGLREQTLADGQAPSMVSANATSLTTILVEFDEPVYPNIPGYSGWYVPPSPPPPREGDPPGGGPPPRPPGPDITGIGWSAWSDQRRIIALFLTSVSGTTTVLNVTLGGDLNSTRPDGVRLLYAARDGFVADAAGNALATGSVDVGDKAAPAIEYAIMRAARAIDVIYTEPVYVAGGGGRRTRPWRCPGQSGKPTARTWGGGWRTRPCRCMAHSAARPACPRGTGARCT